MTVGLPSQGPTVRALAPGLQALGESDPLSFARLAESQGNFKLAETHYEQALKNEPANPTVLVRFGVFLHERRRSKDAIKLLKRALKKQPDNVEGLACMSSALKLTGDAEGAIEKLREALKFAPDHPVLLNNLGLLLRETGRFGDAVDAYLAAIRQSPVLAEAWSGLSRCRKFDSLPEGVDELAAGIEAATVDTVQKKQAYFAIAKIHDDVGDVEKAFKYYTLANKTRERPADADQALELMQVMQNLFPASITQTGPPVAVDQGPRPIFVVGMPRSGTTLVEQILSRHPDVVAGGELNFFTDWWSTHGTSGPGSFVLEPSAAAMTRKSFLAAFGNDGRRAGVVVDKTPFNFLYIGLIARLFPNARFVHCRRDPLDIGLSIYFTDFSKAQPFTTDLAEIGRYITGYRGLMVYWRESRQATILDLDYERMVSDQEAVTRDLLEFCDLKWNERCLTYYDSNRHVATPSDWQVRQPIYDSSVGRWHRYESHLAPLRAGLNGNRP